MKQPLYQIIDNYRVIPRVLIALYGYMCWETWTWFTALPDPSTAQSNFGAVVFGGAAAWFGLYVKSKRNATGDDE